MVLIFCGGKCGSTSLYKTLETYRIPCLRIHNIDHFLEEYLPFFKKKHPQQANHMVADDIFDFLLQFYGSIIVLDSYRDPLERKMSSLFQNLGVNLARISMTMKQWEGMSMTEQQQIFETQLLPILERRHGLDTYYPEFFVQHFDFTRGFQEMLHPDPRLRSRVKFIKLRFCDIYNWGKRLGAVFGWPEEYSLEMIPANQSCEKTYANVYQKWKTTFRLLSRKTLWSLIVDPVFMKYHTCDELQNYFDVWSKRLMEGSNMEDQETL
jgi:hypothetical protein